MGKLFIFLFCFSFVIQIKAQNTTAENILEGSKTLVELVRVLKMPAYVEQQAALVEKVDSCRLKNLTDFGFKNSTSKSIFVSLYKRNGNMYDSNLLTLTILPNAQELLFDLRSGIYKYRIEFEEDEERIIYREGEIKLTACNNLVKEIK